MGAYQGNDGDTQVLKYRKNLRICLSRATSGRGEAH